MTSQLVGTITETNEAQAKAIAREIEQELGGKMSITVFNQSAAGLAPPDHWFIKVTSESFSRQDLETIMPEIRAIAQEIVERTQ